jgi:hypothetical protein
MTELVTHGSVGGGGSNPAPYPAAWRSIERVNQVELRAGDRVLFEAGKSFRGNLRLDSPTPLQSKESIVIGSFGRGRAAILAGRETGITAENIGGLVLRDLPVIGAGRTNNTGYGIRCDNTSTNNQRLSRLRIDGAEVGGLCKPDHLPAFRLQNQTISIDAQGGQPSHRRATFFVLKRGDHFFFQILRLAPPQPCTLGRQWTTAPF